MTMGGYVEQAYAQLYPDRLAGFISIDSAPLQRNYVTAVEICLLKRMEPVYAHYPWELLLYQMTKSKCCSIRVMKQRHPKHIKRNADNSKFIKTAVISDA